MITFNKLWETMKKRGITTYYLINKCGIDTRIIRRLKANQNVTTKTLSTLCDILDCNLEDIATFARPEGRCEMPEKGKVDPLA